MACGGTYAADADADGGNVTPPLIELLGPDGVLPFIALLAELLALEEVE